MDKIKYIKLELPDGTFSESIPISVDARFVDVSENFNLNQYLEQNDININTLKFDTSNNDGIIHGLTGGNPLAADSIESMSDTDHVYVNTDDGYWYYYNSTSNQWVQGGIYQTAEDWKWEDMHEQMSSELESVKIISTSLSVEDAAEWNVKIGLCGDSQQNLVAAVVGTEVSGTNIIITDYDDTKEGKFTKFSGDAFQQSYTGKNILPSTGLSETTRYGVTFTPVYSNGELQYINVNGSFSNEESVNNYGYTIGNVAFTSGESYTLSGVTGFTISTLILYISKGNVFSGDTACYNGKVTRTAIGTDTERVKIFIYRGNTYDNVKVYPMVCKNNTDDTYEPYVGGTASPNPDYPQDIKVVTGINEVKIQNKNLIIRTLNQAQIKGGVTLTPNDDGSYTANGLCSNTSNFTIGSATVKNDLYYTISGVEGYTTSDIKVICYGDSFISGQQLTEYVNAGSDRRTRLSKADASNVVVVQVRSGTNYDNVKIYPMIEQNNQVTSFIKHEEQNYPINLGTIELCKIGDYQDYIYKKGNNWYVHKEVEKSVLTNVSSGDFNNGLYYVPYSERATTTSNNQVLYCNKLFFNGNYTSVANANQYMNDYQIAVNNNGTSKNIFIKNSNISTGNEFRNWINTTLQPTIYYQLETPTETQITDITLISQLNDIVNAQGYSSITYINSNNFIDIYQQLEYLEATASNQYIDTGWIITGNTGFEVDFSMSNLTNTQRVLGSSNSYLYLMLNYQNGNIQFRCPPNQQGAYNIIDWSANTKYNLKYFDNKLSLDGTVLGTYTPATSVIADLMYLFRYKGTTSGSAGLKIYRCKIMEGEIIVRDLIPCIRKLDSVLGMYDIINQQFYVNSGSGAFTPGPIVYSDWPAIVPNYKYNFIAASPSPEKLSEIKVVKGENSVKIQNKNILPNNLTSQQYEDVNVVVHEDGSIVLNGTVTTRRTLTLGTITVIKGQDYSMSGVTGGNDNTYQLWASSTSAFPTGNRLYSRNGKITKTALENETFNVTLNLYIGAVLNNVIIYPMLILGPETTDYIKHQEQNYPITLPNGMEMCGIEDYKDLIIKKSDGWYKYSKIKKIINAETLFYDFTVGDDNKKYVKIQKSELYMTPGLLANRLICNKFKEQTNNTNRQPGEFISNIDTNNVYFVVDDSFIDLDDVQTNLTDVTIYAVMANTTETKITDAILIGQLNQMKNHAATYQGISHITQMNNTDLPIQLDIDYKKSNLLRIKALEESLSI